MVPPATGILPFTPVRPRLNTTARVGSAATLTSSAPCGTAAVHSTPQPSPILSAPVLSTHSRPHPARTPLAHALKSESWPARPAPGGSVRAAPEWLATMAALHGAPALAARALVSGVRSSVAIVPFAHPIHDPFACLGVIAEELAYAMLEGFAARPVLIAINGSTRLMPAPALGVAPVVRTPLAPIAIRAFLVPAFHTTAVLIRSVHVGPVHTLGPAGVRALVVPVAALLGARNGPGSQRNHDACQRKDPCGEHFVSSP